MSWKDIIKEETNAQKTYKKVLSDYSNWIEDMNTLSSEQDSINFIGLSPDSNGSPAPCCLPIPGDPIVGIAQRKKGVVVHAKKYKTS